MSNLPIEFEIYEIEKPRFSQENVDKAFQKYCKEYYNSDLNYHLINWSIDNEYEVIEIDFSTTEKGLPIQPRCDTIIDMSLPFSAIK